MTYWLLPSNNDMYRLDERLSEHNIISWRQRQNFEVGDVLLVYTAAPQSRITYQLNVIKANLSSSEYIDDEKYWNNRQDYLNKIANTKRIAIFELVRRIPSDERLTHDNLIKHGLKTVQVTHRLKGELLDYILSVLPDVYSYRIFPDEVDEKKVMNEGALTRVYVNRYERNPQARRKCIELKGCKCAVCGFDFEEKYGDMGQGFIHIHHITPISSIKKDYQIDYEHELVPLCPNCHAMIHRKDPPYTVDELKTIIVSNNKTKE